MTDERERLRRFFCDLHEADDPPAPAFHSLLRAAGRADIPPVRTASLPGALVALTRGLALAVAAAVLLLALRGGSRRTASDDEALRLATSLGEWQAPTDFLLQTPSAEFLRSAPRLGTGTESVAGDHTDLVETEVTQ